MIPFQTSKLFDVNYLEPKGIEITINQGGSRSTKTYSLVQAMIIKCYENPGINVTIVGQDIPNLKKGPMSDIRVIINSSDFVKSIIDNFNKSDRIYTFTNGSTIEFNSYDNEQDARSGSRDYLYVNEANGISWEIFRQLNMRTKKHTYIDFNPSEYFWANEHLIGKDHVRVIKSTFRNNPFLPEKIVNGILRYKEEDPYMWKVYGLGEFCALEGAIYKNWIIGEFNESLPYCYGLDFGYRHPMALVKCAYDKDNKKVYWDEKAHISGLNEEEVVELIRNTIDNPSDLIVCDPEQVATVELMQRRGFNAIKAHKPPGSVAAGIISLAGNEIIITPDSKKTQREIQAYQWNDKRASIPLKKDDDAMDAGRYAYTYLHSDSEVHFW